MLKELFSMRDKTCLVTGGSSGLGSYITRGFLEAGARRVYITSRKVDACEAAAKELSQYGENGDCVALPKKKSNASRWKWRREKNISMSSSTTLEPNGPRRSRNIRKPAGTR